MIYLFRRCALAGFLALVAATFAGAQTPWRSDALGTPLLAGSSSETGGSLDISAAGNDIWDHADEGHFHNTPLSGDGEVVARILSVENTHPWAKVGVMVRETRLRDSRHAFLCVTPANGAVFQHRATTGGGTASTGVTGHVVPPLWVKLVRSGDTITGYTSVDGSSWTQTGRATFAALPASVVVGIAATSHAAERRGVSRADQLSVRATGSSNPSAPGVPVITPLASQTVPSGALYTYQVSATNSPTSYSATGLPAGLTLHPTTGEIRGVCGSNSGTYSVSLRATNAAGTGTATQTLVVSGGGPIEMPWIQSVTPPADGTYRVGDTLQFRVQVRGYYSAVYVAGAPRFAFTLGAHSRHADYAWGSGDEFHLYTYTVQPADVGAVGIQTSNTMDLNGGAMQDSWPLWCALNMPTAAAPGVRCEAGGGAATAAPVLNTPALANARHGHPLGLRITATNSPTRYGLTLPASLARPLGLTVNAATGEILGDVQASGTYTLTLSAANEVGTGTKTLTVVIPHVVTRVEPPVAGTYRAGDALVVRVTFSNPVQVSGAPSVPLALGGNYRQASYAVGSGQVHDFRYVVQSGDVDLDGRIEFGPSLNLNGGTIRDAESGVDFSRELPRASAASGVIVDAPGAPAPVITSASSAEGAVGSPFTFTLTATNSPTSFSTTALPAGLSLNAASGVISGTPTVAGTFGVVVYAANASGTGSASLHLNFSGGGAVPWQPRDVGSVSAAGSSSETGGVVTLRGSGADIWDNADEFHFRYQQLTGDGEIVARITGLSDTHAWAKAGLMFRESPDPGARHAFLCMTGANGNALQWRSTQNGGTQTMGGSEGTVFPRWLRLKRTGNDLNAYVSIDGVNWTQSRGVGISALPATLLVGLAVTSHNDGTVATATFDNVRITGATPVGSGLPAAPENLALTVESAKQIDLRWSDRSSNESGFEVERSTDNVRFLRIATTAANAASHADTGAQPATTYFYRVRAVNTQGVSAFTPVASATTPAAPPPPSTWSYADIGAVGLAGANSSGSNTITIDAAGHDIWENVDGFRFVYRQLAGDGIVEAQVTSLTNTHPWTKAGVMIRHTLAPDARNVFVFATPTNGLAAQARTVTGAATQFTAGPWAGAPHWVRLVRQGARITAFASPDAVTWTQVAAYDVEMPSVVYVGFAVTSHDPAQLATAVFTDPFVQ